MPGQSHFNLFNKDTHDLLMLCIEFMCQLNHVLFIVIVCYFVHCLTFPLFFVWLLFSFNSFAFHCSLFKRKKFNSDPGLYSRYFDPIQVPVQVPVQVNVQVPVQVPVVREVLYKNTITIYASQQTSYSRLHWLCLSIGANGLLQS